MFFALVPDRAVQAALASLALDVVRQAGGRAVPERNIHMTLAFIGDVEARALDSLREILSAMPQRAFGLALDTLGSFNHAQVAWVASSSVPPPLTELQSALRAALDDAGFEIEARPFRPHVTLARRCVRSLAQGSSPVRLEWSVGGLSLMQSAPAARGVRYVEIARVDFAE